MPEPEQIQEPEKKGKRNLSTLQCMAYASAAPASVGTNMVIMNWIHYFYAPPQRQLSPGMPEFPFVDINPRKPLLPTAHLRLFWPVNLLVGLVGRAFPGAVMPTGIRIGPPLMVAFVMLFGRIIDSVADPLVGYWSDNTRSRRGRRMPFILYGTPILALVFILLWFPPSYFAGHIGGNLLTVNFIYMIVLSGLFFFMYTIVFCPFASMFPELARTKEERIGLSTYNGVFQLASTALTTTLAGIIIHSIGYQRMGLTFGAVAVLAVVPLLIFIKDKPSLDMPPPDKNFSIFKAVKATLIGNRPYRIFLISMSALQLGFNMILISVPYIVTEVVGKSEAWVSLFMAVNVAVSLLAFPVIMRVANKYGKSRIYAYVLIALACMMPFTILLRPIAAALPIVWVMFIFIGIAGVPLAGFYILPNTLVADCVDYEARQTGVRREAMYYGVQGLITKVMVGFSSLIFGILTNAFGMSRGNSLGIELVGPVTAVFILLGWLIFRRYPLTEDVVRTWRQDELWRDPGAPVPPEAAPPAGDF